MVSSTGLDRNSTIVIAIVTGADSGIGRSAVPRFAREGADAVVARTGAMDNGAVGRPFSPSAGS